MSKRELVEGRRRGDRQVPSSGRGQERPSLRGYVNFKPSLEQKAVFDEWLNSPSEVAAATIRVLDSGWKITLAADTRPGVFVATTSTWASGHPSAGIILNTRGTEVHRVMAAIVWALEVVYDYDLAAHFSGGQGSEGMF